MKKRYGADKAPSGSVVCPGRRGPCPGLQKIERRSAKELKTAKIPQVGARQWRWMYGGPNCWKSEPYKFLTSTGAPPVVLKGLVGKGWMWAEKREARIWMPRKQQWSGQVAGTRALVRPDRQRHGGHRADQRPSKNRIREVA